MRLVAQCLQQVGNTVSHIVAVGGEEVVVDCLCFPSGSSEFI